MSYAPCAASLVVGASLIGMGFGVFVPPAAWIGLTLLLHASRSMPLMWGAVCVWVVMYAATAVGNRDVIPIAGPAYFAVSAFYAASIVIPLVFDRLVESRISPMLSTLAFPSALVAAELLRARMTSAATFGSFAYTQYGVLPLMQIAAVVGIWGITFAIAWFASSLDSAWRHDFHGAMAAPLLTCVGTLVVVVLAGSVRVALAPTDDPAIRTAMVNRPTDLFAPGEMTRIAEGRLSGTERQQLEPKLARLHDWFLDGSRREARAGARLIAWPEQNLLIFAEDEAAFLARARRLATDERIYLAMGLGTVHSDAPQPFENKLVLVDPAGRIAAVYLKTRPVAGWEASIMRQGDGRVPVVTTEHGRIAGAICYEADFPDFMRQAGRGSADLLIVPANDWRAIKHIHAQMAAFRAIENGVSLVRPAASGVSTAVDPWGRTLGVADYFASGDKTLTAQVPVHGVRTAYAMIGDLFAWLCVAAVVVLGGAALIAR